MFSVIQSKERRRSPHHKGPCPRPLCTGPLPPPPVLGPDLLPSLYRAPSQVPLPPPDMFKLVELGLHCKGPCPRTYSNLFTMKPCRKAGVWHSPKLPSCLNYATDFLVHNDKFSTCISVTHLHHFNILIIDLNIFRY